ncbi:sodium/bile acid cotransporter 7-B-like isoform X3 [Biomphalaria glabrata]|uniref:Sodium/bile acid cotransporter 7-B-like isoform X3 n=1 Tax=Biomphalaria glabrata TaxID=6526 RepID=A0A9U8EL29_BIOGL|nr:sodium/bile acid cotransporter 7-B-like isoform X3 [Biomphalaria glabrata]
MQSKLDLHLEFNIKMNNLQFCSGLIGVILLAKLAPSIGNKGGILHPEITSKYFAVFLLFFINGVTLPIETLKAALFRVDVHCLIQGFTFVVFPAFMYILVMMLHYSFLHPAILDGMIILSVMPPPVSSAIMMTKAVGGNVAAALFNSAFGSMMGVFITPSLIMLLFGRSEIEVPTEIIIKQLFITVVVPVVLGQIVRIYTLEWLNKKNLPFNSISQWLIFFIIYTTFCASFSREISGLDTVSFLFLTFLIIGLQICIMVFLAVMSSSALFKLKSSDIAAVVYCASHKSITLGIPVIEIIFEGNQNISYLATPLLLYNPIQIVFGGMTLTYFQKWLGSPKGSRRRSMT